MTNAKRLLEFRDVLESEEGLDAETYQRLLRDLERAKRAFGHDDQGRLKVAFFDTKQYDIDSFGEANDDHFALRFIEASLNMDTASAVRGFRAICIFVNDTCDAEVVQKLADNGVELIALRATGYNNVDLDACRKAGISVVRVTAYSPYAIAEHTIGLMLMLNRHFHRAHQRVQVGNFGLDGLTGFDMHGKTVGVFGTGKIGQCVINILIGLGCRILAVDKYQNDELLATGEVTYVDQEQLFAESDVITLHVPLMPSTHHLIDKKAIAQMKTDVMIINTSRGGLIDTKALVKGLKSGKVGGAGLDVYEEEAGVFFEDLSTQNLTDDVLARLLSFTNVVVTAHQAFLTKEALSDIAETTIANLTEYEDGKRLDELTNSVAP